VQLSSDVESLLGAHAKSVHEARERVRKRSDLKVFYQEVDKQTDDCMVKLLNGVDHAEVIRSIHARVNELREMGAGQQDPHIDEPLVRSCQYLLGFSVASLTFLILFSQRLAGLPTMLAKVLIVAGLAFSMLLVTSLVVLIVHVMQGRFRYPFLFLDRSGNPWNWFYYGSISPETPFGFLGLRRWRVSGVTAYATDLTRFSARIIQEPPEGALRADIQHLFLLMSYQAHNHQFSVQLANMFVYGVATSLIGTVLLILGVLVRFI
jgi:hypothetical protein